MFEIYVMFAYFSARLDGLGAMLTCFFYVSERLYEHDSGADHRSSRGYKCLAFLPKRVTLRSLTKKCNFCNLDYVPNSPLTTGISYVWARET